MEKTMDRRLSFAPSSGAPLSGAPDAGTPRLAYRWARFSAGLLLILLLAFGVIPALQRLEPVREVREAIHNSGIDATALIYSESEVSSEAEYSIRDALKYPPHPAHHADHSVIPLQSPNCQP